MQLLFIGEQRSRHALERGWTWQDRRLSAKPLFRALKNAGINLHDCHFENLLDDEGNPSHTLSYRLRYHLAMGWVIVALGKYVCAELCKLQVRHMDLVHPATRGAIRKAERYDAHIRLAFKRKTLHSTGSWKPQGYSTTLSAGPRYQHHQWNG